jgi:carbon monoxide dehydrogenase subunit G
MAVFTIYSNENHTKSSLKLLFNFLSDFKNFKSILPEDKVEDFVFNNDECSFNIKGITPMKIKIIEKKPFNHILFSSEGLAKFNFSLKANLIGVGDEPGHCTVELMGDLNPIIKSMAEKSLQNLVNTMSLKLSELELNEN